MVQQLEIYSREGGYKADVLNGRIWMNGGELLSKGVKGVQIKGRRENMFQQGKAGSTPRGERMLNARRPMFVKC